MACYSTFVCSVISGKVDFLSSLLDSYYGTKPNWSVLEIVLRPIDLTSLPASTVFSSMTSKLHAIVHSCTVIDVPTRTVFDILRDQLHVVFFTIPKMTQGK